MHAKSHQSCPTLCDPVDCSPSGFSVHGILQARILQWVAMTSSRGSSWPRGLNLCLLWPLHCRRVLYHCNGKPINRASQCQFDEKLMCKGSQEQRVRVHPHEDANKFRKKTNMWRMERSVWNLDKKNTCCEDKEPNPEWLVKSNQISLCLRICGLILCSRSRKREQAFIFREKCKEKLSITDTVLFFFLSSFNIEMGSRPN